MALVVLQSGAPALGLFDAVDAETTTFLGGEVCTLVAVTYQGTDLTAQVSDGYTGTSPKNRPAVSKAALSSTSRPLFLADDGISGYGTLFGKVVGGTAGQQVINGANLGPHTATGSGKITLHNQPGLYGVTLDAVDVATVIPSNNSMTVGIPLYYTSTGLLTTTATNATKVGNFIEFGSKGSLVNTPNSLVAALNSPSGSIGSPTNSAFAMAVFQWNPPTA